MPIKNNIAERNMFISYRRDTGIDIAARVKDFFVSKGLNVFYDITSMQLGEFDKQIIQHINSSDYFVLILSPNALDRCCNETDWVRKEIECALNNNKIQIIPLILPQFKFPQNLPDSLEKIKVLHGIEYNAVLFDMVMDKLFNFISENNKKIFKSKEDLLILLNELYDIIVDFRDAFHQANQDKVLSTIKSFCSHMQNIYYFHEKNIYIESELSKLALSICNQFNAFVVPYNEFSNSQDRMSSDAQKAALCAENELHTLVSLILKTLSDLKTSGYFSTIKRNLT